MAQCLTAFFHGCAVQLFTGFVLPAGVYAALISSSGTPVHAVVGNLFDISGILFVQGAGIISTVTVGISIFVYVEPDLFIAAGALETGDDFVSVRADNRRKPKPTVLVLSSSNSSQPAMACDDPSAETERNVNKPLV